MLSITPYLHNKVNNFIKIIRGRFGLLPHRLVRPSILVLSGVFFCTNWWVFPDLNRNLLSYELRALTVMLKTLIGLIHLSLTGTFTIVKCLFNRFLLRPEILILKLAGVLRIELRYTSSKPAALPLSYTPTIW